MRGRGAGHRHDHSAALTIRLSWVEEAYPLGYTLLFCEGLTPEEVLQRLGARRESLYPLTRVEAQEIEVRNSMDEPFELDHPDVETLEELGFLRRSVDAVVRAGAIEGWAFAIQASTSYVTTRNFLPTLCADTRVLVVSRDINAVRGVAYAVEGRVLPDLDLGDPARVLEHLERRFGLWVPEESEGWRLPAAGLSTGGR
ncbi:DUF6461 domain-containing protein [Streptomyces sp. NPDC047072]|uniref:DUF6461 domain-containing protein n=1 Tax=Streptomyces sp. NPDC047072 TaxID=3154809 RepID=UPI0033EB4A9E